MRHATLDTELERVLSKDQALKLKKSFGMFTVRDLLNHSPRKYLQRSELTLMRGLPVGELVTISARVVNVDVRPMRNKNGKITEVIISDDIEQIKLTWFNNPWILKKLQPGTLGLFSGKVSEYRGQKQLTHPDFQVYDEVLEVLGDADSSVAGAWIEKPVPIYSATSAVKSWTIAGYVEKVLGQLRDEYDPLPNWVLAAVKRDGEELLSEVEAYRAVHLPRNKEEYPRGLKSLKFRESFELQLALLFRKEKLRATQGVPRARVDGGFLDKFDTQLPYTLTGDQRRVGEVIAADLASGAPMHRLLQGEVGSGKTLVALRAMLQVADMHGQAALLAPTEVLASQHARSIIELLGPEMSEEVHVTLLTGQLSPAEKKSAQLAVASGKAKIVIGTHALMSEATTFEDLGLIIIDEQHRFGVEQREALRRKAQLPPHVLVMTATPIPRTVALTFFSDLEFSTLREMPAGRAEISSFVVPLAEHPKWWERSFARAYEEIQKGRQVYIVCPAIREAELEGVEKEREFLGAPKKKPLANVEEILQVVQSHPQLKNVVSRALTGEMSRDEKEEVMVAFAGGKVDLLVATTVIEVGVNVPNASTMIVLDADRFGVSQLHQLRGRVGRGSHAGLCLFVTNAEEGTEARARVAAVAATSDGFELAQVDLEMRGEGDVLGSSQSGSKTSLKWIKVVEDQQLIEFTGQLAATLLDNDPALKTMPDFKQRFAEQEKLEQLKKLYKS